MVRVNMLRSAPLLVALCAGGASAQSINIDLGRQGGVPGPAFAGAGVAGVWNTPDLQLETPQALVDVAGIATGATIVSRFGPRESALRPDPGTTGAAEMLLDDGIWGTADVLVPITIAGLAPGRYKAIGYGFTGNAPNERTWIDFANPANGRSSAAAVGGAWTGAFEESVTHHAVGITSPDGIIEFYVAGGIWGQSGFSNGLQLVKVCNADLTTGAIPGQPGFGVPDGALNSDDFFYFLDRFAAGDLGEADMTTLAIPGPGYGQPNGILNNDDFFYYLNLFAVGC
ncbi:MAG: hypothetical protein KDA05_00180 [Phycisphaerales bacterium]|nr:hypothetical protein [Phycisphaerales bacterium]MCB9841133.1 hypothetical protein [Phycisphaeraceae bacterium]